MARDRDYHQEYLDRVERAEERGFGSLAEERDARSLAYEMGADRDNVERFASVFYDYDPGHYGPDGEWVSGDMDLDDWREAYAELHDIDVEDINDDDFWEWLQEYYSDN